MSSTKKETYLTTEELHGQYPFFSKIYWRQLRMKPNAGPKFLKVRGKILYRESDVRNWLDSHPVHGSTMEYT